MAYQWIALLLHLSVQVLSQGGDLLLGLLIAPPVEFSQLLYIGFKAADFDGLLGGKYEDVPPGFVLVDPIQESVVIRCVLLDFLQEIGKIGRASCRERV